MKKLILACSFLTPTLALADPPEVGESLFLCRVPFTQDKHLLRLSEGVGFDANGSYEATTAADFGVTNRLMVSAMMPFTIDAQEPSAGAFRVEAIYQLYANKDNTFFFSGGGGINAPTGGEDLNTAIYLSANMSMSRYHISAAFTGRSLETAPEGEGALGIFVPISRVALTAEGAIAIGGAASESASVGMLVQLKENIQVGGAVLATIEEQGASKSGFAVFAWEKGFAKP